MAMKIHERLETDPTTPRATGNSVRRRLRVAGRMLGSLLLGGVAVLGPILIVRQGLLPLIEVVFHPGPEWLSVFRRIGILVTSVVGYWAFVHWHEKREATELRVRPIPLLLGGASGAILVAVPMAVLFALGIYERVLFRGVSSALFGVAALIGIAALLEELVYRCLLFRLLERAWGTRVALVVQAVVFAVQHLENVARGGIRDAVTMLVSVTLGGLLWAAVFVLARNLWAVAANHAAWNFTILLTGLPLSGIEDWRKLAPLESRFAGPDWLTGGIFGPESSWLVMASTTVAVALLLRAAQRRGCFLVAAA